jgi:hypothetical protein
MRTFLGFTDLRSGALIITSASLVATPLFCCILPFLYTNDWFQLAAWIYAGIILFLHLLGIYGVGSNKKLPAALFTWFYALVDTAVKLAAAVTLGLLQYRAYYDAIDVCKTFASRSNSISDCQTTNSFYMWRAGLYWGIGFFMVVVQIFFAKVLISYIKEAYQMEKLAANFQPVTAISAPQQPYITNQNQMHNANQLQMQSAA